MLKKRSISRTIPYIVGVLILSGVAFAQSHNLSCYAVLCPASDFVENDVALTPRVAIANLTDSPESHFQVKFIAIKTEDGDTAYLNSVTVENIEPYDSLEIEMPDKWYPVSQCKDYVSEEDGPFVQCELFGIVALETDEVLENDTVCDTSTCLWKHDAGVIALDWPEEPDTPPDRYSVGSVITPTATVENFGMNAEYDIPIRLEIRDLDSGGILIWHNVQQISFLDWRGNDSENPYVVDVFFPSYVIINEHDQMFEARVELIDDDCPEDDNCWRIIDFPDDTGSVVEDKTSVARINIELSGTGCTKLSFTLPQASRVRLDVFDVTGRHVRCLTDDTYPAGEHELSWDQRDELGSALPRGVYVVTMRSEDFNATRKVVVR